MNSQAKKVKNQILASKISVIRSLNNEQALKYELTQFFQDLKKSVLNELEEFYSEDFMFQAHADLILAPIFEAQQEYYNILRKFNHKEYQFGRKEGRRLVKLARKRANRNSIAYADKASKTPSILKATINKDELFGTNPWSEQKLLNQTFTASERTMNRIDSDINKILSDGYRNGNGINSVRNDITKRFDQLSSWEATRIARTEIHNAHNMGTMDIYQEMGVEYTQWIAAHDSRTRTSHLDVDREIIPRGGTYSNGLRYPGDTSGPIEEWINCRCSNAPFVIPDGYIAPSFAPFKEEDLIATLNYYNQNEFLEDIKINSDVPSTNLKKSANSPLNKIDSSVQEDIPLRSMNPKNKQYSKFKKENTNKESKTKIQKIKSFSKKGIYKLKYGPSTNIRKIDKITYIKQRNTNYITVEEIHDVYIRVPDKLKNDLKEIVIKNKIIYDKKTKRYTVGGVPIKNPSKIVLYKTPFSKEKYFGTIIHELAHMLDNHSGLYSISNSKWEEAFIKDKEYIIKQGLELKNEGFVSDYAKDSYYQFKHSENERRFSEDFADSVELYLTGDIEFLTNCPHRCEIIQEVLGVTVVV